MGTKLLWTGATLILASTVLAFIPSVEVVGAVIMAIGLVLLWLDK